MSRFSPESVFDAASCSACGRCSVVCPVSAVSPDREGRPVFDAGRCIACGHCAAFCPSGAFGLPEPEAVEPCGPESLLSLMRNRRSTRFFDAGGVTDAELERLLEPVGFSPTGVNACGLAVRAYRDREALALGAGIVRTARLLGRCGLLRILGALTGTGPFLQREAAGEDLVFRNAPLVLFFYAPRRNPTSLSDGIIAATLVMTGAEAMGLGTFWNGVALALYPLMRGWRRSSGARRGMRLCAVLCAGRPAWRARPVPPRDWELLGPPNPGAGGA